MFLTPMFFITFFQMSLKKLTKVNTGLKCCHLMLPCNNNCKEKFRQSAHYCSMIKKEFFHLKSHSNNINVKLSLSSSTLHLSHTCHFSSISPRIAIVGSGPAGFYTAQHIIKVQTLLNQFLFRLFNNCSFIIIIFF